MKKKLKELRGLRQTKQGDDVYGEEGLENELL